MRMKILKMEQRKGEWENWLRRIGIKKNVKGGMRFEKL